MDVSNKYMYSNRKFWQELCTLYSMFNIILLLPQQKVYDIKSHKSTLLFSSAALNYYIDIF